MEQLTDYSINFPHLHIYLHHVGKNIMIGNFSVAYYGIVIAIGMLAGLGIACWMAKRTGQKTDTYFDLALVAIICSVIGARVYYVIFRWDLYKDDLLSVFNLRQGGLAIYGGGNHYRVCVFTGTETVHGSALRYRGTWSGLRTGHRPVGKFL